MTIKDASGREQLIKDKMGGGEYFGERALLQSEPRNVTITVTSEQVRESCMTHRGATRRHVTPSDVRDACDAS